MKCKPNCGKCCTNIEIPHKIFNANKDKIQREIIELRDYPNGYYPITKDKMCCFLTADKRCAIYPDRPEICRLYGESDDLPCMEGLK